MDFIGMYVEDFAQLRDCVGLLSEEVEEELLSDRVLEAERSEATHEAERTSSAREVPCFYRPLQLLHASDNVRSLRLGICSYKELILERSVAYESSDGGIELP